MAGKTLRHDLWRVKHAHLIGKTVGRLTVTDIVRRQRGRDLNTYCVCRCECGTVKEVKSTALRDGKTVSCGCLRSSRWGKVGATASARRRQYDNLWEVVGDIGRLTIRDKRGGEPDVVVTVDASDVQCAQPYYWVFDGHTGYVKSYVSGHKRQSLHQLLAGKRVDHRDQDKLNNRRENLRPATQSQNQANIGKRNKRVQTSQYKGVGRKPGREKPWQARIRVNGRLIHLGRFKDEVEAARAYDAAAREHFGEFACCNFP